MRCYFSLSNNHALAADLIDLLPFVYLRRKARRLRWLLALRGIKYKYGALRFSAHVVREGFYLVKLHLCFPSLESASFHRTISLTSLCRKPSTYTSTTTDTLSPIMPQPSMGLADFHLLVRLPTAHDLNLMGAKTLSSMSEFGVNGPQAAPNDEKSSANHFNASTTWIMF